MRWQAYLSTLNIHNKKRKVLYITYYQLSISLYGTKQKDNLKELFINKHTKKSSQNDLFFELFSPSWLIPKKQK